MMTWHAVVATGFALQAFGGALGFAQYQRPAFFSIGAGSFLLLLGQILG